MFLGTVKIVKPVINKCNITVVDSILLAHTISNKVKFSECVFQQYRNAILYFGFSSGK